MKIRLFIAVIPFFFLATTHLLAQARTYYVDTNRPTNGDGTISNPWNNLTSAIYWWGNVDSTDVIVYLRQDTITLGASDVIYIGADRSGNNGHYFVLKAYPGENVVISGTSKTANFSNLVSIVDAQYIKLEGITFSNLSNISAYGIYISGTSAHVQIKNCKFKKMHWNTDLTEARYPLAADFIDPIIINGTNGSTALTDVLIDSTTFQDIAPGYGDLVVKLGNIGTVTQQNTTTSGITRRGATSYFVSPSGNDATGSGSINKPWKTISAAVNAAGFDFSTTPATLIDSNITINLRAGIYAQTTTVYIGRFRGTNNKWFTIQNYNGEYAVVEGANLIPKYSSIFVIDSAKCVRIKGLDIRKLENDSTLTTVVGGVQYKDARYGIAIVGTSANIEIKDNDMYNMKWTKDTTKAKSPQPNDVLSAITVLGTTNTSIKNITITGNTIHNIVPGYAEVVAINGNVDTFTVTDNEIYDNANIGIVAAGNYPWVIAQYPTLSAANNQSRNGLIKDNEVYRCISPVAVSAGIYLDGSKNVTVDANESYNNGTGISLGNEQDNGIAGGHMIKYNDLHDNLFGGIFIGSNNKTSWVENSTIKWNSIRDNFVINTGLYNRANGKYGVLNAQDRGYEIYWARARNITFEENEIESLSNNVAAFAYSHSNLILRYNLYYTADNNPCKARFTRDTTTNINDTTSGSGYGWPDVTDTSFHQYVSNTGFDATSELADVAYNSNGCQGGGSRLMILEGITQQAAIEKNTKVYPNPASSFLKVRIYQEKSGTAKLQLMDISGKLLLKQERELHKGLQDIGWNDVSRYNITPGVYLLQVSTVEKTETFKILISR